MNADKNQIFELPDLAKRKGIACHFHRGGEAAAKNLRSSAFICGYTF
jgi:hypothetical protein